MTRRVRALTARGPAGPADPIVEVLAYLARQGGGDVRIDYVADTEEGGEYGIQCAGRGPWIYRPSLRDAILLLATSVVEANAQAAADLARGAAAVEVAADEGKAALAAIAAHDGAVST